MIFTNRHNEHRPQEILRSADARRDGKSGRSWSLAVMLALVSPIAVVLVLATFTFPTQAATLTWKGGGGANANVWHRSQNWSGGGIPTSVDIVQFDDTANSSNLAPDLAGTNGAVASIAFLSGTTNAYNITNTTGTANLTVHSSAGILNSSATDQQFSVSSVNLATSQTWSAAGAGNLTFSSAVSLGANTLTLSGSSTGAGSISGIISGTGGLLKTGTNTWTLSGANTYSGPTTIGTAGGANSGTLAMGASNVLSSGALTVNAGTLSTGAGSFTDTIGALNLGGGASGSSANITGNGVLTLGGNVTYSAANNPNGATIASGLALGGNRTFNIGDSTAAAADLTVSGNITGTGNSITKTGAGTLVLSGTNTYTGNTTLSAGSLHLNSTTALGSGAGTFAISTGTSIDNSSGGAITLTNNNGQSWNGSFGFAGTQSLNLGTGAVTLTATPIVTVDANTLTVGGVISGSGLGLTKAGAGTMALTHSASTYTGATSVTGGILSVSTLANGGANSSIGASSNAATSLVLNGGTLQYTGGAVSSDRLFSVGTGSGTLDSSGSGTLTLTNTGSMGFNGQSGTRTLTLTGSNNGSVAAVIGNNGAATSVTKNGTGTWTLAGTGSNTYTGTTTVNAGTLALAKTGGAVAVAGNLLIGDGSGTDTVRLDGNSQIASTSAVTFSSGGTPTLDLNGNSQTLGSIASANTGAVIALGSPGSAKNLTVGDATSTTYAGTITGGSNASFVKQGTGTLTLSGASTHTGATSVNNGTLKIQNNTALGTGTAGTTVASGATLQLDGGLASAGNGTLTLSGTGFGGAGALVGTNGGNRWANNVALAGNTTIRNNDAAGFVSLGVYSTRYDRVNDPGGIPTDLHTLALGSNTLTLAGTGNYHLNTRITGTGNMVIDLTNSADTVTYWANTNTYTGTTTVKNGLLQFGTLYNTYPNDPAHPNWFAINGPLVIGDGTGAANTATVKIGTGTLQSELLNFTTPVTLHKDGLFLVQSSQTINTLTFNGGRIDVSTNGGVYLNGDVTVNASAGNTAVIDGSGGTLSLTLHQGPSPVPNANRVFNVVGGVGNTSDLTINSIINNGSITKNGAGTMTITGNNTFGYEGTTTINNGILAITHSKALGQADGTDTTATTVNSGGTLQLQNNITVNTEKLTLNGNGFGSNGALQNQSGNNTWAGGIVLGSNARMQSDAGLLTISGSVTSATNANLDVRGSSNTTISGDIGTGNGGLTKNGTGTLILSGSNTFAGATTISQGVLSLQSNTGLGSTSAGTTVASGAALELSNATHGNLNTSAEPLTINGTGISGNGALRNAAGTNTFGGLVTLGSASLITANSGSALTIAGGLSSANHALTVGTTANNGNVTVTGNVANGTGSLTKAGTGSLTFSGTTSTVGQTQLNAGTISVTGGSTLNTREFSSVAGTTLLIASGGTVVANYASGNTTFSGAIDGTGGGIFQKNGAGTLTFNNTFDAGIGSTLVLNGGTLAVTSAANITFGTIRITGNTVLDFNNSAGTVLSSGNLIIDPGVTVTVNNWVSVANSAIMSTIWKVTTQSAGVTSTGGSNPISQPPTQYGTGVLPQIGFTATGYGSTTTWVTSSDTGGTGWFDREIRPTPEPSTYGAIFISACLGLLAWRRFHNRKPVEAAA